jgi:hypothetical protein
MQPDPRMEDGVKERIETVKGTIGGAIEDVAGPEMRTAAQRGAGVLAENPLGLMLGALGVGFVAGLLLPVTTYERETVGPLRDDLLDRAQSVGSEALEHGRQVLAETAQAALQTAQLAAQRHVQQVVDEVSA